MAPGAFLEQILVPGLTWLAQVVGRPVMAVREARLALLAFAGQETDWVNEKQIGGGPGVGEWQLGESTCWDLLANPVSNLKMHLVCAAVSIPPTAEAIYGSLPANAHLRVATARLLLWDDPNALPAYGDEEACWEAYSRVERPGKPSRERWSDIYPQALEADQAYEASQETA